jgi:hypothetical protein
LLKGNTSRTRFAPSGIASTFEVLVALVDLDDSDELSALVLPVNVRDVIVVEVDGAAAGAAVDEAGAATGTATGATAATGNGVTLSATGAAEAAPTEGASSSGRWRSNASASDGVCAGVFVARAVPAWDDGAAETTGATGRVGTAAIDTGAAGAAVGTESNDGE